MREVFQKWYIRYVTISNLSLSINSNINNFSTKISSKMKHPKIYMKKIAYNVLKQQDSIFPKYILILSLDISNNIYSYYTSITEILRSIFNGYQQ